MKTKSKLLVDLLSNYKAKLSCLIIALFLWLLVVSGNSYTQFKIIPFLIINPPPGHVQSEPIPNGAEVVFWGSGRDLIELAASTKYIALDMKNSEMRRRFSITKDLIKGVPHKLNVTIEKIISPDTVTVSMEPLIAKRIPVSHWFIQLEPMEGYIGVGEIKVTPDSIDIHGPRSVIKMIDSVITKTKIYSHLIKDFSDEIDLVPPNWSEIRYSRMNVRFSVDIQRIHERVLYGIPVQVRNMPSGFKAVNANPSVLALTIHGGVDEVSKITIEDISAVIDYSKERSRSDSSRAVITVPKDVIDWTSKPQFFQLRIER